uniref:Uncharacterized protein n=1 Tax=Anguilla anguilla TaxID=7936 RepID=A0A0E9XTQ0_ANGAN
MCGNMLSNNLAFLILLIFNIVPCTVWFNTTKLSSLVTAIKQIHLPIYISLFGSGLSRLHFIASLYT